MRIFGQGLGQGLPLMKRKDIIDQALDYELSQLGWIFHPSGPYEVPSDTYYRVVRDATARANTLGRPYGYTFQVEEVDWFLRQRGYAPTDAAQPSPTAPYGRSDVMDRALDVALVQEGLESHPAQPQQIDAGKYDRVLSQATTMANYLGGGYGYTFTRAELEALLQGRGYSRTVPPEPTPPPHVTPTPPPHVTPTPSPHVTPTPSPHVTPTPPPHVTPTPSPHVTPTPSPHVTPTPSPSPTPPPPPPVKPPEKSRLWQWIMIAGAAVAGYYLWKESE